MKDNMVTKKEADGPSKSTRGNLKPHSPVRHIKSGTRELLVVSLSYLRLHTVLRVQ